MTQASRSRTPAALLAGLALGSLLPSAAAQNAGNNYSLLHNGVDVAYLGLGAGAGSRPSDGMGTWIPGEDLKGPRQTSLGDWGHRQVGLTESVCVLGPDPGASGALGGLAIVFPNIALVELDGRNGHRPDVFTAPACTSTGLLGMVSGVVPYGVPETPGVATPSASFLLVPYPSALPSLPSAGLLLPNGGLLPSGHGGTATLLVNTGLAGLAINSTGFCWTIDFNWVPTAVVSMDDVDGWWHWAQTSPDDNQYWAMSTNEMNAWQSFSVARVGAGLAAFTANLDSTLSMRSADPQTLDALQPAAAGGGGVYETTLAGASGGNPGVPGAGFDLGRHGAWSQSGLGGVPNPASALGNQDPAGGVFPGAVPTVGFATFNNQAYGGVFGAGGFRLTWVTVDFDALLGLDPALSGDATVFLNSVRVPSPIPSVGAWPQAFTISLLPLLTHDTAVQGWPDPYGAGGALVSGTSAHVPLLLGTVCIGVTVALTYGTSGLLSGSGPLAWDPGVNATSGAKQLYYLD